MEKKRLNEYGYKKVINLSKLFLILQDINEKKYKIKKVLYQVLTVWKIQKL